MNLHRSVPYVQIKKCYVIYLTHFYLTNLGQYLIGGCQNWLATVAGSLALSVVTQRAISVKLLVDMPGQSLRYSFSCVTNSSAVVANLVSSVSGSNGLMHSECDGNIWVSQTCGGAPILCVNCLQNPCDQIQSNVFAVNPCGTVLSTSRMLSSYTRRYVVVRNQNLGIFSVL